MMRSTTSTDGYSFRLDADSSSTYSDASTAESIYKRRIDSLFRDSRAASSATGSSDAAAASNSDYEVMELAPEGRSQQFHEVRSAVQAQIEKMFAGNAAQQKPAVQREPARAPEPARLAAPQPPAPAPEQPPAQQQQTDEPVTRRPAAGEPRSESTRPAAASGARFKVDYLGALAIEDRATRLEDLQFPLKRLYMEYRVQQKRGKTPLPGSLEITDTGVKVQYVRELHRGVQEVFNPFQTIAVWAAVKFVAKRQTSPSGQPELKFAFLPLICDPESQEKFTLYNELAPELAAEALGVSHPPVFACVMRKPGLVKTLECHGFVCGAPEDAIVIAANLYQALLSSMRSEPAAGSPRLDTSNGSNSSVDTGTEEADVPRRPPRRRRAPQPPPDAARREPASDERRRSQRGRVPAGRGSSVRSPSRSRSRARNSHGSSEHSSRSSSERGRSVSRAASTRRSRRLTRSASDRHGMQLETTTTSGGGPGRLPRSRSFAEINGRVDIKQLLAHIQARDGIRTVDDVLRQVVNPGGMSFSDLRPEHRELLLRLALTLSKDEMYQRSKHIMKKQTKKLSSVGESDTDGSTISSVLKATKKSFSRFSSRSGSFQSPSTYLREHTPLKKLYNARGAPEKKAALARAENERAIVSVDSRSGVSRLSAPSSGSGSQPRAVPKTPMPSRAHRVPPPSESPCDCGCDSESVYSSKCYCTLPRAGSRLTKAKSTYDLPCACDTESCAESEKCYCSLKRVSKSGLKVYQIKLDSESETTDGSARSTLGRGRRREYGSMGNLSRADSPSTAWRKNAAASLHSADSAPLRRGRSSTSLLTSSTGVMRDKGGGTEYGEDAQLARRRSRSLALSLDSDGSAPRPPPAARPDRKSVSIDNLHQSANGFIFNRMNSASSLSTTSNRSRSSVGSGGRFLLVSAADPSGKIVYRGASQRQAARDGADAISMKKTTEIAATFSGLKLNQTTDLLGTESEDDAYSSMQNVSGSSTSRSRHGYSDQNMETSLGYLP
ncbi:hypothetical protein FJT64_018897 [Amphibalanus amphitrite]|uniref:PID domain-containing protein n=1 Tax=Amphibalanus amphitrite TaxID=1232801 RepID=A0A6A4WXM1_AMPAM|nr:hypothetical protein FJT64_018897 [Amphibalanus amphitrite]